MNEKPLPPWASEIPEGAFISYSTTYKIGEYFSCFHKDFFTPCDFDKLGYYFYDPTEHGFAKGKKYPLFIFMHGTTNSLENEVCINYAGAEFYAKEEYQKAVGGAYLLIPLANEYRDKNGVLCGGWNDSYVRPIYDLICNFITTRIVPNGGASKKVIFGNARGATIAFSLVDSYINFFNVILSIGGQNVPDDMTLARYEENNIWLFLAMGKHDEYISYEKKLEPRLEKLMSMFRCFVFTPDWVCNGDHGIASINLAGLEMGQHCIINPVHCNLMFDDGTPMEPMLPNGVTGWLSKALR